MGTVEALVKELSGVLGLMGTSMMTLVKLGNEITNNAKAPQ
jgi:hypothetical protein